jgi:hypothetical protein
VSGFKNKNKQNIRNKMKHKFIITLSVDISKVSDTYAALSLVDGVRIDSVEASSPVVVESNGNGHMPEKPVAKAKSKAKAKAKVKRNTSIMHTDPRAVLKWSSGKHVLNTDATLKNLGISKSDLLKMKTRNGTLEGALKRSIAHTGGNQ